LHGVVLQFLKRGIIFDFSTIMDFAPAIDFRALFDFSLDFLISVLTAAKPPLHPEGVHRSTPGFWNGEPFRFTVGRRSGTDQDA
jgi:hypothetical protein